MHSTNHNTTIAHDVIDLVTVWVLIRLEVDSISMDAMLFCCIVSSLVDFDEISILPIIVFIHEALTHILVFH